MSRADTPAAATERPLPVIMDASAEAITRERWLMMLAEAVAPKMQDMAGITMPLFRVSCSWPSRGGTSLSGRVVGQCWAASASEDNHAEIFITPMEDDPREVAETLVHEMIHACLPQAGHGPDFKRAALAVGYTTPMRSTPSTPAFWAWVEPILQALPAYPHRKINAVRNVVSGPDSDDGAVPTPLRPIAAPPPQKNRQMKCTCATCGYIARTSRKWIDRVGPPICPVDGHGPMIAE